MMKHKHAVNQKEHKHAELLRMAADNEDQLFECDECIGQFTIYFVAGSPSYNWRPVKATEQAPCDKPVKQTKTIKLWLWADKHGKVSEFLLSDFPRNHNLKFTKKLLWSETEFEVGDD